MKITCFCPICNTVRKDGARCYDWAIKTYMKHNKIDKLDLVIT